MIRFLADADLNPAVVLGVRRREPAADFQDWRGVIPEGLQDPDLLALAARSGRILVSHDLSTMRRHFVDSIRTHESPGLVLVSQRTPISRIIADLILMSAASDEIEWRNTIVYLPL